VFFFAGFGKKNGLKGVGGLIFGFPL